MKTSKNVKGDLNKSNIFDRCQTPFYALDPLLPHLPNGIIWESAAGDGHIVAKLASEGFKVISSDILTGQNFLNYQPEKWDCQVTNPPYSIKYEWLERSYETGKPFALLLPFETWAADKGNRFFERFGVEVIIINPRINFKMPHKGYTGNGAQFSTAWFTFGLNIGNQVTYAKNQHYEDGQLPLFKSNSTVTNKQLSMWEQS